MLFFRFSVVHNHFLSFIGLYYQTKLKDRLKLSELVEVVSLGTYLQVFRISIFAVLGTEEEFEKAERDGEHDKPRRKDTGGNGEHGFLKIEV